MKVGIIGSGQVGQVLASAFLSEGHEVMLGTREPKKESIQKWKEENSGSKVDTFENTANFAELIVLATKGSAAADALDLAKAENLNGKVIIDSTNPILLGANGYPEADHGVVKYFTDINESLMERLQTAFPLARFVKAFNSVGNAFMYKPNFGDGKPTMFICGNDSAAKELVTEILTSFGWDTADMGLVESARPIESLCVLWCVPGFLRNEWSHAFKLLK